MWSEINGCAHFHVVHNFARVAAKVATVYRGVILIEQCLSLGLVVTLWKLAPILGCMFESM